ncbi:hypothetical protein B566_EDAN017137 [Ephemera danica]|nr:hypothetical protein B566_EDAN017137 [Ephemera danica]
MAANILQNRTFQPPGPFSFVPTDWPAYRKKVTRWFIFSEAKLPASNRLSDLEKRDALIYMMGDDKADVATFQNLLDLNNTVTTIEVFVVHLDKYFTPRTNIVALRAQFFGRRQKDGEANEEFIREMFTLVDKCGYGSETPASKSALNFNRTPWMRSPTLVRENFDVPNPVPLMDLPDFPNNLKHQRQTLNSPLVYSSHHAGSVAQHINMGKYTVHLRTPFALCVKLKVTMRRCAPRSSNHSPTSVQNQKKICRMDQWRAKIQLGRYLVNFKVDSGADVSAISHSDFEKLSPPPCRPSKVRLVGAANKSLEIIGVFGAEIKYHNEKIFIIKGLDDNLLSRSACDTLFVVEFKGDRNLTLPSPTQCLHPILSTPWDPKESFPECFTGLGQMAAEYKITLRSGAEPYAISSPRRIPHPIRDQVKSQLDLMPTEWCAALVPVPKASDPKKVRICVDHIQLKQLFERGLYYL